MNLMYVILSLVLCFVLVAVYLFLTQKEPEPTLVAYLNLLHKYEDTTHPKLVQMRERGDEEFKRLTKTRNSLWEATRDLRK